MADSRIVRALLLLVVMAGTPALAAEKSEEKGDESKGLTIFEQLCGFCHGVAPDGSGPTMGPSLFGLMGRKAATEPNYPMYSAALKASGVEWNARSLDDFLANPMVKVPGTTMPVLVPEKKDRTDLIAYLATLK